MKKSELRAMIRQLVAEELRAALPAVLSEMYIKRIVAEGPSRDRLNAPPQQTKKSVSVRRGPVSGKLSEVLDDDAVERDESVPSPMMNTDKGIYNDSYFMKESRARPAKSELLSEGNPLSFIYDSIKPIPDDPHAGLTQAAFGEEGLPLGAIAQLASLEQHSDDGGGDADVMDRMGEIFRRSLKVGPRTIPVDAPMDPKMKMMEIAERRKLLDSKRVG